MEKMERLHPPHDSIKQEKTQIVIIRFSIEIDEDGMGCGRTVFGCLGRFLLGATFIASGLTQILDWQKAEEGLLMTLYEWHMHIEGSFIGEKLVEFLIPLASSFLGLAVALQLIGGILLFLGIKVKWSAFLLLLFLVPATLVYHAFWLHVGERLKEQLIHFLKNGAVMAGLLLLLQKGGEEREKRESC